MTDKLMVRDCLDNHEGNPHSWRCFGEASVGEVVVWLREQGAGKEVWLCREGDARIVNWAYGIEPNDPHCWFNGPRKHNPECGPHQVVPLDTEPPKE